MMASRHPSRLAPTILFLLLVPLLASCGGTGAGEAGTAAAPAPGSWNELARPRPEPLPDAPRVTVAEFLLLEERPWGLEAPISSALGLAELVSAGLLRRRDVEFVERRRFSRAAERERQGLPRPEGAPEVGVSRGHQWLVMGNVAPLGDSIYVDLRLIHAETGANRAGWRLSLPGSAEPVGLARRVVGSLLNQFRQLDMSPAWEDPVTGAAPDGYRPTGIAPAAFAAFMEGVAAEEEYYWEGARRAYLRAIRLGGEGFFEADVALARVARLRAGGTLGGS